jgi:hypothetical protein
MKRALIFASVCALILAAAIMIFGRWSSRTSAAHPQPLPVPLIVAVGTSVPIRLTGVISEDSKAGDTLQGVTAEPVLVNSQIAIPVNTRAVVELIRIQSRKDDVADVIVELKELIARDHKVPVHSGSVKTSLNLTSDVDLLARSLAGIVGSAVGAAGSASVGGNPDVGAARLGARLSGGATEQDTQEILVFKTAEPLDVTTAVW